jgi:hypothetical protein
VILWAATAVAVFYSLSALALAILFIARLRIIGDCPPTRVNLVLPATGALPGLEDLLDALAAQSLQPNRLIIAVESRDDPAHARVAALADRWSQPNIEIVIAGLSSLRSQKCTNILAALAQLDGDDAPVVLLDADIRPQPWWLAMLVAPLAAGRADIVNGYRWPMPATLAPGAVLATAADRAVAVLPRLRRARAIWGGSVAATRHALDILDLPNTIGRTLTEDLPIGDRAIETGLRVLTRRAIRVPTPFDGSFGELWRFGRRQYQLIRIYRPGLWSFAALTVTTDLIARITLFSTLPIWQPGWAMILIVAALGSITTELRLAIGSRLGAPDRIGARLSQHLLAWAILPGVAFHASLIWGGSIRSPVVWRHVRYVIDRAGRVAGVSRFPYPDRSNLGSRPASADHRPGAGSGGTPA